MDLEKLWTLELKAKNQGIKEPQHLHQIYESNIKEVYIKECRNQK